MTWVKICGTTNLEDALTSVDAGADAVGFVFYEKSPRKIDVEAAREIVEKLPASIEKVGVFVGDDLGNSLEIASRAGLTGLQSYSSTGGRAPGLKTVRVSGLRKGLRLLVSLPMNFIAEDEKQTQEVAANFANFGKTLAEFSSRSQGLLDTFVMDSGDLRAPGGTGKAFDWKKAVPIAEGMRKGAVKLVVAGGLTPDNVSEAIAILRPWGVDVASGVEAKPGKKDPEKVRAFVRAVREIDRKTG